MTDSVAGRFRILRRLGSGGRGEVFLAEDSKLRRRVALKQLSGEALANPESRRHLLHEARAAARLNHPNIASVYDVIETADSAYIVMEYVPGDSLDKRILKGPLVPEVVIRLGLQAADALAAAHAEGVVHRDLKPANIALTPAGTIKILDFGMASTQKNSPSAATDSTTSSTRPSLPDGPGGTLPYMPPEALKGAVADERGDIYSLGVTLFELLTGRRPFAADDRVALVAAISSAPVPRASEVNRAISEELSAVVARAMARERGARHQSAEELRSALRDLTTHGSKLRRWVAALVIGATAIAAGWWAARHPETFRAVPGDTNVVAVLPFLVLGPDSLAGYVAAGITDVVGTNLASLPMAVVPLGETSRFRAADRDLDAVARELGVSLLLDGSVQRQDERLRVTLKMFRAGTKVLAWTHICDGDVARVLGLQEEILAALAEGLVRVGALPRTPGAALRERLTRPPTRNEDAYADYTQARAFLEREDIPENVARAITLFESAFGKDPSFSQALGGLGEACFANYRRTRDASWASKANEATARALALDPTGTSVRYSRSVILLGTGAFEEAERELQHVLREQPDNAAAHSLLGDVHDKRGQRDQAIAQFQAAIRLRREYWRPHWRLASVLFDYGRLDEARDAAQRVTELQPDNPRGHQTLGTIYQAQGKVDAAMRSYEVSLRLTPTAAAYSNIGGKFFDEKDFVRAEGLYRKAVEIDPKLPVYRRNHGDALVELGREAEARATYSAAVALSDSILEVNPNDAGTRALKALCLAKVARGDEARREIDAALRLTPGSPNVLYKHTAILALLGQEAEALRALEKALDAGLPADFATQDPDLRSISGTQEFQRLVARK